MCYTIRRLEEETQRDILYSLHETMFQFYLVQLPPSQSKKHNSINQLVTFKLNCFFIVFKRRPLIIEFLPEIYDYPVDKYIVIFSKHQLFHVLFDNLYSFDRELVILQRSPLVSCRNEAIFVRITPRGCPRVYLYIDQ